MNFTIWVIFQAGAEVDLLCPPQPETTALKLALLDRAPNSLIQLLLQSGADPHLRDGWGHNALYWAGARQNLWAMKWFIAENVNMEPNPVSRSVVRFVNGMFLSIRCREFTRVLKYLRAMQIMVLHAHAGSSSITMLTGWQYYIKLIKGDIEASVKGLQAPSFRTYELVGEKLREICDMVNVLIDMSSNPFSLRHLCRVQIRSSLGRDLHRKVRQLDVPLSLQEYLKVYKECDIIQWCECVRLIQTSSPESYTLFCEIVLDFYILIRCLKLLNDGIFVEVPGINSLRPSDAYMRQ